MRSEGSYQGKRSQVYQYTLYGTQNPYLEPIVHLVRGAPQTEFLCTVRLLQPHQFKLFSLTAKTRVRWGIRNRLSCSEGPRLCVTPFSLLTNHSPEDIFCQWHRLLRGAFDIPFRSFLCVSWRWPTTSSYFWSPNLGYEHDLLLIPYCYLSKRREKNKNRR